MAFYAFARYVQSEFPFLLDVKAKFQRTIRKALKRPFELEFQILKYLTFTEGNCIIDVGGNRGQSIDAIRLYNKNIKIHSFEPNAILFKRLIDMFIADNNIEIHNYGLGNEAIKAPLYIPYYNSFMYDGLASFDYNEAKSWLNAQTIAWFDPKKLEIKEAVCNIKKLDDYNLKPDFIKIDAQGFEENVLRGGALTIEKHKPVILMEINPNAENYLFDLGWSQFSWINGKLIEGKSGLVNNIFIHPDKIPLLNIN